MFVSGVHALHPNAVSVRSLSQEREELQKHAECLTQINENILHIYSKSVGYQWEKKHSAAVMLCLDNSSPGILQTEK